MSTRRSRVVARSSTKFGTSTSWRSSGDGLDVLHVDRHLVHDVTSPQAFTTLAERYGRGPLARAHLRFTGAQRHHPGRGAPRRATTLSRTFVPLMRRNFATHGLTTVRHRLAGPRDRPCHRARAGTHPARSDGGVRRQSHLYQRRVGRARVRRRHQRADPRAGHPEPGAAPADDDEDHLRRRAGSRRGAEGPHAGRHRPTGRRRRGWVRHRVRRTRRRRRWASSSA